MEQVVVILTMILYGFMVSKSLFSSFNSLLVVAVSPFIGLFFFTISVGILLVLDIELKGYIFLAEIVFIYILIHYFFTETDKNNMRSETSKGYMYMFLFAFSMCAITYFIDVFEIVKLLPDSVQFEVATRFFANGGSLYNEINSDHSFLINGRLLTIAALKIINALFFDGYFYVISPIISISFLLFLVVIANNIFILSKLHIVLFMFVLILVMFLNKHLFVMSFSLHNNIIAIVLYSISLVSYYVYLISGNLDHLKLSMLMVVLASITRIEMFVLFAPLLVSLYQNSHQLSSKEILKLQILFVPLLIWFFTLIDLTPYDHWYVEKYFVIGMFISAVIFLCALRCMSHVKRLRQLSNLILLFILFMVILHVFIKDHEFFLIGSELFFKKILYGDRFVVFTISSILAVLIMQYYKENMPNILIFQKTILYLYVLMYVIVLGSGYSNEDHSISRILILIVPPSIISVLFLGIHYMAKERNILIGHYKY